MSYSEIPGGIAAFCDTVNYKPFPVMGHGKEDQSFKPGIQVPRLKGQNSRGEGKKAGGPRPEAEASQSQCPS
jgi:hypothetical protein